MLIKYYSSSVLSAFVCDCFSNLARYSFSYFSSAGFGLVAADDYGFDFLVELDRDLLFVFGSALFTKT